MRRREFIKKCGYSALYLSMGAGLSGPRPCRAASAKHGLLGQKPSPYFIPLPNKRVKCSLCPRGCVISPGERGHCQVRENQEGRLHTLVHSNPCAINVDPIEKKPFYHLLPGSSSFSLATAGCNIDCKFCQNWEISQARPDDTFNYHLPPEELVELALAHKAKSIASTYVEPTIFMEYMLDIGPLARKKGLLNVVHSNGYVNEKPLLDLCRFLDAACIDLKSFNPEYYRDMTGGRLEPVLDTLKLLRSQKIHLEVVTLLLPGLNDSQTEVAKLCRWVLDELGPETPLHFTRFYPAYKLKSLDPTPVSSLEQARNTAMQNGLEYVYVGNVPGHPGESTYCPGCGALLVKRTGYQTQIKNLKNGKCDNCARPIPGRWDG